MSVCQAGVYDTATSSHARFVLSTGVHRHVQIPAVVVNLGSVRDRRPWIAVWPVGTATCSTRTYRCRGACDGVSGGGGCWCTWCQ